MIKLNRLSKVMPANGAGGRDTLEADTVRRSLLCGDDRRRAFDVLLQAQGYYSAMSRFRRDRERNKRYNYGDQWGDVITVDGKRMTEEEYIYSQGNIPLKNNLIRRLVRNVIGVYRQQATEPTCVARDRDEQKQAETMSTVLQYNMQLNRMTEIYARSLEEFLISGLVVHRKSYGWRNDKMDCWTDYVQPNNVILDPNMRDFRGWDCSFIGEIHDVSFETVCQQFAESPEDYRKLAGIYAMARNKDAFTQTFSQFGYGRDYYNMDFLVPRDHTRCRVIEVWRKESRPRFRCHDYNTGDLYKIETRDYEEMVARENSSRLQQGRANGIPDDDVPLIKATWFVDDFWYYYYISPMGDILKEGETPYEHKSHPYVFKPYPFIDGEIHSFVADVLDQQRYTNRLITLYDWIMRASAKGVLLIPDECIPATTSPEEFADTWARFNGVVVYTPSKNNAHAVPQQISSNSTNIGINELLNLQLKFFEDISGVNGALQGKPGYAGMSAALYSQQTQNATTSLLDLLDCFQSFIKDAAYKDVKNIQQFYDQKRIFNISGRAGSNIEYDPKKIRDVEFDMNIVPSTATPSYRAMANDFLMEIWKSGQASLEQILQVGEFPFADELLQNIQSQKEQLEQGQVPDGLSPQLMRQVQDGANMDAVNGLHQLITGGNGNVVDNLAARARG